MIFAFLFGLSMDYEVFMLSRMREAYDETGSTPGDRARPRPHRQAGHERGADPHVRFPRALLEPRLRGQVFAIGLAAGIIFDATVIRALLVPSLMAARRGELVDAAMDALGALHPQARAGRARDNV